MLLTNANVVQREMTSNQLKYIAIILMFFDHLFAVFIDQSSLEGALSRIPGRIVAPIMCYLIAEGFFYTSNVNKYIKRLLIFSAISHFPYVLYFGIPWWKGTSVFWSLALGLIALAVVKGTKYPVYVKVLAVIACCILAVPADWYYIGVLWILFFGLFRGDIVKQLISFAVIGVLFHVTHRIYDFGWLWLNQLGMFLAVPLLLLYKGKQGKKSKILKWGFYIFYPLHLLLLYYIYIIIYA
ncbi:TraX family protein [Ureibacillus acetophenoni]|uniref:TraX protein n=1 Tax=Ureibacillus acetophenoni TaxID=614649 RepID=A0A285UHK3_9BACL|nr:TraX family protein [Ureibacillus acetophenoni]SOC40878.1 TraX protein [Ureibacillus acetophenoni]